VDPDDPSVADALIVLRELILAAEKYRQAASAYLGLDVTQAQAVSYLYNRGPMGHGELAALLGYNTSSITALVDRLERDQIARRLPHPADRRRTVVELTEHGRAAVDALRRWFAAVFADIDPAKLPEVTAALSGVAVNLRAQAEDLAAQPAVNYGHAVK
jgi:DNA-binding MarR family transcriptional regulator